MTTRLTLGLAFVAATAAALVAGCGGGGEACTGAVCGPGSGGAPGAGGSVSGLGGRGGSGAGTAGSGAGTAGSFAGAVGTAGNTGAAGNSSGTAGNSSGAAGSGTPGAGGAVGTAGNSGTAGSGTPGVAGAVGTAGVTGTAGTGTPGAGGSAGTAGTVGTAGVTGTAGSGTAGAVGAAGTTGTAGSAAGSGGSVGTAGSGGTVGTAGTGGGAGTTAGRGGTGGSAGAGGSGGAAGTIGSGIVLWYKFDEASGTTAADASGNARNGTLTTVGGGTGAFSTTHQVGTGAVNLGGTSSTVGAYVNVPASLNAMGATTAVTIACWVNVSTARNWARVWDFNSSSTTAYAFLTTQEQTNGFVRFAITTAGNSAEQQITSAAKLATGWHHIAIVLDVGTTYTGTMYIDGASAGTNTAMTLRPSSLGNTANNAIGKSAFTQDPYFAGLIDDFRVYSRALSASEITMLYAVR